MPYVGDIIMLLGVYIFLIRHFHIWGVFVWIPALVFAVYGFFRFRECRQFGVRGRPLPALHEEFLFFGRPAPFRPDVLVPLAELSGVVVYGVPDQRTFRLVRKNGTHQEARIFLGNCRLEKLVIGFLEQSLPPEITVSAKEPPTFFERVRGYDP
jgi:hypothetical protein